MVAMDIMVVMAMIIIVVTLVMFIMVIRTDRQTRTNGQAGQTDRTFKLDFPGNLCRAAFAILFLFIDKVITDVTICFNYCVCVRRAFLQFSQLSQMTFTPSHLPNSPFPPTCTHKLRQFVFVFLFLGVLVYLIG